MSSSTQTIEFGLLVRGQFLAGALALIMLVLVIRLVRKSALRDAYALLWTVIGLGTLVVSISPAAWWDRLALTVGIDSGGTTLLLVIGLFGVLILIMQVSISLTRLERLTTATIIHQSVEQAISRGVTPSDEDRRPG